MGGAMKYFPKKLLGQEVFRSMVSWAKKYFFEKFVKPSAPPSYIFNVRSLRGTCSKIDQKPQNEQMKGDPKYTYFFLFSHYMSNTKNFCTDVMRIF